MATLHVHIRTPSELNKICLKDVNLNDSVIVIRKRLQNHEKWTTAPTNYNLIHFGMVLKDEDILQDIGIKSESLIFCTPKCDLNIPAATPLSMMEVQQLMSSLRSAAASPNFRTLIKKFSSIDHCEKFVLECPSLRKDPAALAFVQDPDLLLSLLSSNLEQHIDSHPALGRLLQLVCTMIMKETSTPRRSHNVSYSIDALSDEEMEVDLNDGESASGSRFGGSASFQPITPAQLAAALANAGGWGSSLSSSAPRSGLTTPSSSTTPFNTPAPNSAARAGGASPGGPAIASDGGTSPGGPVITTEMFSQALQNALAASASRGSTSVAAQAAAATASTSANPPAPPPPLENLEESLQLMREMGIADEQLGVQALQATNGDVQAAVNLIFAQWMADD